MAKRHEEEDAFEQVLLVTPHVERASASCIYPAAVDVPGPRPVSRHYRLDWRAVRERFAVALDVVRGCAPINFGQDVKAQITRMEQVMKHEHQLQGFVFLHGLKFHEVSNIDSIGPQNLSKPSVQVIIGDQRLETALAESLESVELKSSAAQEAIDVAE